MSLIYTDETLIWPSYFQTQMRHRRVFHLYQYRWDNIVSMSIPVQVKHHPVSRLYQYRWNTIVSMSMSIQVGHSPVLHMLRRDSVVLLYPLPMPIQLRHHHIGTGAAPSYRYRWDIVVSLQVRHNLIGKVRHRCIGTGVTTVV